VHCRMIVACWIAIVIIRITDACSHVRVATSSKIELIGRTMELGFIGFNWKLHLHPRNETLPSPSLAGLCLSTSQISWKNKYGFVSVDGLGVSIEGMNEKGLTVSPLIFESSSFPTPRPGKKMDVTVCSGNFAQYVLANFETTKELQEVLEKNTTQILGPLSQEREGQTPSVLGKLKHLSRLHWAIDDAHGGHIVVEVIDGNIVVTSNDVGVMTNDPEYAWHLRNLDNYAFLTPFWPSGYSKIAVASEQGQVPQMINHGFNLMGLPGDSSPPSRFVKLFYLRQFALLNGPPTSLLHEGKKNDTFTLVDGLLNTAWIVKGTVAPNPVKNESTFEKTDFSVIKNPKDGEFYFRSYGNSQWKLVRLGEIDWEPEKSIPAMPLSDGTLGVVDVSDALLTPKKNQLY